MSLMNPSKSSKNLFLFSLLTTACISGNAYADSNEELLQQMKVMQKQIEKLQTQLVEVQKKAAAADKSAKVASATATEAKKAATLQPAAGTVAPAKEENPVKITLSPGPKFETADGAYSFAVGGFVQADAALFDDDRHDYGDGTIFRRARLNVSGVIAKDFAYKLENDFANNGSVITDAYLQYKGLKPFTLTVGQFKEPFGLEELTSDLHITFLERASLTTFVPDRNIGVALGTNGDNWTFTVGGFGAGSGTNSTDDESKGVTARATFAPIANKDSNMFLHLGVAGSYRIPEQSNDTFTYGYRPMTNVTPTLAVSTGALTHSDNRQLLGLEGAFVYGPFSFQSEYMMADVNREAGFADGKFDGYYMEASYFLTGETRNYSPTSGKFEMTKIPHPFSLKDGTWGAWQVMARYGDLDLNDGPIYGGNMKDISLGLKWYPHERIRVMLNYSRINTDNHAVFTNDDPNVWMLRTQFDF